MIPITRPELPPLDDYVELLREIWGTRMLSNFAQFAQALEGLSSGYLGTPTLVVASGDIGLMLAIKALELAPGSHVLVSSFTFNSTINAVLWNGLTPVFVDVDPVTFNMDPGAADEVAGKYRPGLILATHVFGNPADAASLRAVADRHGARLAFDAAHGYGSLRDGAHVGTLGDIEVFSLSGTKPVTSGEGGLISSGSPALLERLRYLRGYGFLGDYNSLYVGLNGKMSELHAALGFLSLARIEQAIDVRHALVERYRVGLAGLPVAYQSVRTEDRSTYKDVALLFESGEARERVERRLEADAIQTKRYFRPCHAMPAFLELPRGSLVATERLHERVLCVPAYESLTQAEQDTVIAGVREGLEQPR